MCTVSYTWTHTVVACMPWGFEAYMLSICCPRKSFVALWATDNRSPSFFCHQWGGNTTGQLTPPAGLGPFAAVTCGFYMTCAAELSGGGVTW